MHRVLIVSPHFPPTNAPDMQRARQALPHLAACGWEAEVLAVDPEDAAAPQDELLAVNLPTSVRIHRIRAPRSALDRLLRRTSLGRRAVAPILQAGDELLATRRFHLVFFTTTQFAVLNAGREWLARHQVPYVADWQDPWVTDYYDRPGAPPPPGGWRYRFAARAARRDEGLCLQSAIGVVSVNADYLAQLRARYGWFGSKVTTVIPFGAEPADFDYARAAASPAFVRQPNTRHLVYVGAVGAIMRPAIDALLQGVRAWIDAGGDRSRLRLHFIGTSYAPAGQQIPTVLPLANRRGLTDVVTEHPARVGHFTALRTLLEADACLLLGSDNAAYSPSKTATVALSRRPILALVAGGSGLEAGLQQLGLGRIARFTPTADLSSIREFLESFTAPKADAKSLDHLTAATRTRALAEFFSTALAAE